MAHLRFPLASTCAVLAFVLFQQGRAQCYHPDGSAATSDYQPCHAGRQSMCCAINRSDGYVNRCRPDDLCLEINTGVIWRESCTDPTWQDPACLQLCTSGLLDGTENMTTNDIPISVCGDGSYCCGVNNTNCCLGNQGFWVSNDKVYPYGSSPFTSSFVSSSTATSGPSPTSVSNSTCVKDDTGAKKVALGVGLALGIPILILLASILFLITRRRPRGVKYHAAGHGEPAGMANVVPKGVVAELPQRSSELES